MGSVTDQRINGLKFGLRVVISEIHLTNWTILGLEGCVGGPMHDNLGDFDNFNFLNGKLVIFAKTVIKFESFYW